jgi:hypothetical protein
MKKLLLLILLVLFCFQFVSAVEFNLRENFSQGETIITKISGNFLTPLSKANIFFYREPEHVKIPIEYDISKLMGEYYAYVFISGKPSGNYSFSIEDARYLEGTAVIEEDIARNFVITPEKADFSLEPGFISASEDFFVEVQNLKDKQIIVKVKTQSLNTSERNILVYSGGVTAKEMPVSVNSGEVKKIYFKLGTGISSLQTIELSSGNTTYNLPVYISTSVEQTQEPFSLEPSELISSIPTNSITKKTIYLYNTQDAEIKNISFSLSEEIKPFVNLSDSHIDGVDARSNYPIELSLFSPEEIEVSGTLKVNINGQSMLYSQISLKFLEGYVSPNESKKSDKTCAELNGSICDSSQKCSQQTIYAIDAVCCPGTCDSTAKKSSTGVIIGIIILVVIAGGIFWFYKRKYKTAKKPVDLLKEAKPKKLVSFWAKK